MIRDLLFSSRTSRNNNRVVRRILIKLDLYLDDSKFEPFAEIIEVIVGKWLVVERAIEVSKSKERLFIRRN